MGFGRTFFISLALASPHVQADLLDSRDLFDLSLEELLQVEVTGVTQTEQSIQRTPASVNVFVRAMIARLGVANLTELFRFVPGMQTFRSADGDYPNLVARGRAAGSSGREIMLLINGQRIDSWWTTNGFQTLSRIGAHLIERVEFIRGPTSQLYGSNAFLEVINVTTIEEDRQLIVSSGNRKNYQVAGNFSLSTPSAQHTFNFNVLDDKGQDYRNINELDGEPADYQDPLQQLELYYQLNWQDLSVKAMYLKTESEGYLALSRIDPDWNRLEQDFLNLSLEHSFDLTAQWSARLELGYRNNSDKRWIPILAEGSLVQLSRPSSSDALSGIANGAAYAYWGRIESRFSSEQSQLLLAGEWLREKQRDQRFYNNYDLAALVERDFPVDYYGDFDQASLLVPEQQRIQTAAWAQYIYTLSEQTEITLGLRYDGFNDLNSNLSHRAALVHQLTPRHTIKLIHGSAFRGPTFLTRHVQNSLAIKANPNLKSEKVNTTELI